MRFTFETKRSRSGWTMIELMVAVALSSLLLMVLMMLASYSSRSFLAIGNYVALDQASRKALDDITLKVREADGVIQCSSNRLELSYRAGRIVYQYNPNTKLLSSVWNGETNVLLSSCDSFQITPFQRNPIGGAYDQYPATMNTDAAKIIQVSWVCSRKALNGLVNSESVQSAKIVIRKQ